MQTLNKPLKFRRYFFEIGPPITSRRAERAGNPSWRNLYEAAILEGDLMNLPLRIEDAKKAIGARLVERTLSDQNGEREALVKALNVLEDLLKMSKAA